MMHIESEKTSYQKPDSVLPSYCVNILSNFAKTHSHLVGLDFQNYMVLKCIHFFHILLIMTVLSHLQICAG